MTREENVDRIWGDAVRRNINIVRDDVVEMVDFVLRKHCPEPQGLDEVPKKDWLDEYNEKVDAVIGSSCYSEKGLDEAAEEYAENDAYGEPDRVFTAALMGFKAGAEWMARQGVSMQVTDVTEWSEVDLVVHKNVCEGSIIQIRNK